MEFDGQRSCDSGDRRDRFATDAIARLEHATTSSLAPRLVRAHNRAARTAIGRWPACPLTRPRTLRSELDDWPLEHSWPSELGWAGACALPRSCPPGARTLTTPIATQRSSDRPLPALRVTIAFARKRRARARPPIQRPAVAGLRSQTPNPAARLASPGFGEERDRRF